MSFGESMFLAGFNRKTTKEDLFVKGNYGIPPRKQRRKTLEDSRRLSTYADLERLPCGVTSPTYRPTDLWGPLGSPSLLCWFSTALRIVSPPFIQVGLIQGLRIDALAYIYLPAPPSRACQVRSWELETQKPNAYFHQDQG